MQSFANRIDKRILGAGSILFLACLLLFVYTGNFVFAGIPFAIAVLVLCIFDWKTLYWVFILCIPLSGEVSILNGVLSTTVPDEQLMWLFVGLLILLIVSGRKLLPEWFLRHPLTLVLFLQYVWLLVAVIFSQDLLLSAKYLAAKTWFWTSFIIFPTLIIKEKKDFVRAFLLFAVPTLLHAVFAFLWHYSLHFGYHESNKVVFPFYKNHVDYSTVLSMIFPLFLVAFQLCKGKRIYRILIACSVLFLAIAIYVAAARAAMLAIMFALVVAFAIRKKLVQWIMPGIFLIVISAALWLAHDNTYLKFRPDFERTFTQKSFVETVTGTFTGADMSSMERFYRWIAGVRMSQAHPLVGVGPNNFYENYKPYTVTSFRTWVSRNEERSTTHNYFLLMLVEQGWPATILYGALLVIFFKTAQRIYHRTNDRFYKKVAMGLAMLLAAGFVNNFFSELLETHKIGALFYISITLIILLDHLTKKQQAEITQPG